VRELEAEVARLTAVAEDWPVRDWEVPADLLVPDPR
jgi:hypothetical protein